MWSEFSYLLYLQDLLFCLIIWNATCKTYLEPLRKLQNKAMHVINNMQWSSIFDPLFKKKNFKIRRLSQA